MVQVMSSTQQYRSSRDGGWEGRREEWEGGNLGGWMGTWEGGREGGARAKPGNQLVSYKCYKLLRLPMRNSASGMFVQCNLLSFGELLRKSIFAFRGRIQSSNNTIIKCMVNSVAPLVQMFGNGGVPHYTLVM